MYVSFVCICIRYWLFRYSHVLCYIHVCTGTRQCVLMCYIACICSCVILCMYVLVCRCIHSLIVGVYLFCFVVCPRICYLIGVRICYSAGCQVLDAKGYHLSSSSFDYGKQVTVSCETGYYFTGSFSTETFVTLNCESGGQWSIPDLPICARRYLFMAVWHVVIQTNCNKLITKRRKQCVCK